VHFTIRRLERSYGAIEVRQQAAAIADSIRAKRRQPPVHDRRVA
jgi:hypothetical protein